MRLSTLLRSQPSSSDLLSSCLFYTGRDNDVWACLDLAWKRENEVQKWWVVSKCKEDFYFVWILCALFILHIPKRTYVFSLIKNAFRFINLSPSLQLPTIDQPKMSKFNCLYFSFPISKTFTPTHSNHWNRNITSLKIYSLCQLLEEIDP